jgi:hypothetical protein
LRSYEISLSESAKSPSLFASWLLMVTGKYLAGGADGRRRRFHCCGFYCRRTLVDRIWEVKRALGPNAKTEASDRKIYLPVEVGEDRKKGGWVWSKIDGTKTDLVSINRRVASRWRRKDRRTHDSNA